jgi:hypothetical protein
VDQGYLAANMNNERSSLMSRKNLAKVVGLAMAIALVTSAFAAASASATTWSVSGSPLAEGKANGKTVNASLKAGTTATLKGKLLGQEFVLHATTLSSENGLIYQEGSAAKDSGVLVFSGLSVEKPSPACEVASPIKTKPLASELTMDVGGSETAYDKFVPAEGLVFATITVKGCAVAGSYNVKGEVFGEGNEYGVEETPQPLNFSPAINASQGGSLTLGSNAAELTLEGENTLSPAATFGATNP